MTLLLSVAVCSNAVELMTGLEAGSVGSQELGKEAGETALRVMKAT